MLRLDGLGVRDLCPDGDDLLVLAGPTMDLDGPVRVYRWHGACRAETPQVVRGDLLTREIELPYGEGDDHAEGIGLLGDGPAASSSTTAPPPPGSPTTACLADVVALSSDTRPARP